jgi:hypothetical protein
MNRELPGDEGVRPVATAQAQQQDLVDEAEAHRLAAEHGLPPLEVDAALFGETVDHAESVLRWIDAEEGKLVRAHVLLAGRKLYKPMRMLKDYARKHRTGRYRNGA